MNILFIPSANIYCKKEVLGRIFDASIAGIDVNIHFPNLPIIDEELPLIERSNVLLPPENAKKWKRGDSLLSWGYSPVLPSYDSCVELLSLSVECNEKDREDKGRALYYGAKPWRTAFADYLSLATKQNTERDKSNSNDSKTGIQFWWDEWPSGVPMNIFSFDVPDQNAFAAVEEIENAINFASSGKELHLEYQMLLSSYKARRNYQNRQAIIDACAAVELCLNNSISDRLSKLDMNPKLFLDKFRSLGDKFDLIKQLDKTFPTDDHQKKIVDPRNGIAHNRNAYPDDKTTDALISCVESCLEHFFKGYY